MTSPLRPFALPLLQPLAANPDLRIFPSWAHPQVRYWSETWAKIRDAMLGEQEIKDKGEVYLPRMGSMDEEEYAAYKERGVFFNMTARTINALVGQLFEKDPETSNVPAKLKKLLATAPYDKISLEAFVGAIGEGLVAMGRYGVLVDMDVAGLHAPFLKGYETENILDWSLEEVDGRMQPVMIVLREFVEKVARKIGENRLMTVVYRVLSLDIDVDGPIYRQYIYRSDNANLGAADLANMTPDVVTPTIRGTPWTTIPFQFFGAKTNTPAVDRPPAADIVALNLAHYKAYVHLEHGRFFCAMPVYYVARGPGQGEAEYHLGPSVIWEVGMGEKPGILEFNGQGLKTLETSCAQKEDQIAMIGARLMGGYSRSTSESDQQASIKETNERSLQIKIIDNIDEGMSNVLNWWAAWQDEPNAEIKFQMNTAFLGIAPDARAMRAAQMMYEGGLMPITALHDMMQKAGWITDEMDVDTFKKLLDLVEEFPNNPDVWARMKGYAGAANRHDVNLQRRTLRDTETRTDILQTTADAQKTNLEDNVEIKRDQVDAQATLIDAQTAAQDAATAALEHDTAQAKKDIAANGGTTPVAPTISVAAGNKSSVQEKGQSGDAPAPGGQKPTGNNQSKPLPSQVAAARQSAPKDTSKK